jgi:metallo-beta-lactamase family protein
MPPARLQFLGANRQVTGSRYRLDAAGATVLIDCGLFQERCCLERNWEPSPVAPDKIAALILTHAHLDHCGLIPRLVADGYAGPIHATFPSIDLARLVLEDSARIQEEDAAYKRRRHQREGRRGPHPEAPLYTVAEARRAFKRFRPMPYGEDLVINPGLRVRGVDAGHILGSASLEVRIEGPQGTRRIVFSGDVGPPQRPLLRDPEGLAAADYVVLESTYGDREHPSAEGVLDTLAEVINQTVERGGNVLMPTFAIDRAQQILYLLARLVRDERIPRLTIFLDSPMAVGATAIYKRYRHLLDEEAQALIKAGEHPFQFPGLHLVRTASESRSINSIRGSCIILAGSGMCTGGRIKHHLRHNIGRPESTVLFTGYQAQDTLGRHILEKPPEVRIHGRMYPLQARIAALTALSAHADRAGLLKWLGSLTSPPRHVFLTHGEPGPAQALAEAVRRQMRCPVTIPEYQQAIDLE